MAQISNDPDVVHQLKNDLSGIINNLKTQQIKCTKLVDEAETFWKDSQYKTFSNSFKQGTDTFKKLFTRMNDYNKKLDKLEKALRDYIGTNVTISRR